MLKKLFCFGMFAALLVGCNANNEAIDEQLPSLSTDPQTNHNSETSNDEGLGDIADSVDVDSLPLIMIDEDHLILIDALTNEVLAEFVPEKNLVFLDVQQLANDIFGFSSVPYLEAGDGFYRIETDDGIFTILADGTLVEFQSYFFLLDQSFNLVREFRLTDENATTLSNYVTWNDDQLKIYYSLENRIYVYNVNQSETVFMTEIEDSFRLQRIELINENQVAFLASHWDNTNYTYYGVIDLDTGETRYSNTDFPVREMVVNGEYLLLTENIPPQIGVPQDELSSRGEVILFNSRTGEDSVFQLERLESRLATVIGNRYVLTGSHEHIRLYSIETNEIVLERQPEKEMILIESFDEDIEGIHPHIYTFLSLGDGIYAVVFNDGHDIFHVEWIVLED